MPAVRHLCTFFLDDLYFGVEVHKVQEVLLYQEMTRVPLAPSVVRGLINLRGHIVTAIDMRRRFDLPPLPPEKRPMNVVIRTSDGPVSLLVDEIGDVLEVDADSYERPPEILRGPARELIQGAYKLDGRLLLTLNSDRAASVRTLYPELN
jgi:purine-binding chemotaxis protein CheW